MKTYAGAAVSPLTELLSYSAPREDVAMPLPLGDGTDPAIDETRLNQQVANLTRGVRVSAIHALEAIGPEASSAIPALELFLQDSDKDMRAYAAIALWKIAGRTDGVPAIAEACRSLNWGGMHEGLQALGEMGPAAESASGVVEHLTRYVEPHIHKPALAALEKINPAAAAARK